MRTPRVMCVAWNQPRKSKEWCATIRALDSEAMHDSTLCGKVVILRIDSMRRVPTCPECKRILRERQS